MINLCPSLTEEERWRVLLHEWVHAVLHVNGVASILPEHVEEVIAQSMEHGLEEMLKQIGKELTQVLVKE